MLVPLLRSMPRAEVRRRQQALAEARPQIIFEAANSTRAGATFLELAVSRCFPRMASRSLHFMSDLCTLDYDSPRAEHVSGFGLWAIWLV